MLSGTRVRIIASAAHRLVVERSYIYIALIYASLQIVQLEYWMFLQFTRCFHTILRWKGAHILPKNCVRE